MSDISKKNAAAGGVISLILLVLTAADFREYMSMPSYGPVVFILAVCIALAVFPASIFRPDREKSCYPWLTSAVFFAAPLVICGAVELLNGNFLFAMPRFNWIDNYCVILIFLLLIFAASGSVRISVFVSSPLFLAFGIVNMYIKEFKGSPLVPMDVGSIATAVTVADGYTYELGMEISFSLSLIVLLLVFTSHLAMPAGMTKRMKLSVRSACLALVLAAAGLFYGTDLLVDAGYRPDFFNQMRGYKNNGAVLSFIENTRYLRISAPDGYDPEKLADTVPADTDKGSDMRPDILVIMNESFADLSIDGDFGTDKDVMPYIDSMEENTVKGHVYTPVFGSGTSNTEFEFLTGDPAAFFPSGSNIFQLYVDDPVPGLVSTLDTLDYDTYALHPYFKANWNREKVYEDLGFDKYTALEDMLTDEEIDYYKHHGGTYFSFAKILKERYGSDVLLRKYVSDEYDYKTLLDIYDSRDRDKPFFMFNVTMQNHSPYDLIMPNDGDRVSLTGLKGDYRRTEQYLSLIRKSDKAFGKLVEHFKNVSRPVIILMFGDHQPFVEDGFYEEVMGADPSDLSDEDYLKRYATRFVLWANYDIEEADDVITSASYLSDLLRDRAGIPETRYDAFRKKASEQIPVITPCGCIDKAGRYFKAEDEDPGGILSDYEYLTYNNCIDSGHMVRSLFYPDK